MHIQLVYSHGASVIFLEWRFPIENTAQRTLRGEITHVGASSEAPTEPWPCQRANPSCQVSGN